MTTCFFGPSGIPPRDSPRSSSGATKIAEMLVSDGDSKRMFIRQGCGTNAHGRRNYLYYSE